VLATAGRTPEARALLDQAFKYATLSAPLLMLGEFPFQSLHERPVVRIPANAINVT
jgi:hypothetical protein